MGRVASRWPWKFCGRCGDARRNSVAWPLTSGLSSAAMAGPASTAVTATNGSAAPSAVTTAAVSSGVTPVPGPSQGLPSDFEIPTVTSVSVTRAEAGPGEQAPADEERHAGSAVNASANTSVCCMSELEDATSVTYQVSALLARV